MSDDSISHGEDKENLLYIAQKIRLEEFTFGESDDHNYLRESIVSVESDVSTEKIGSDVNLYNRVCRRIGYPDIFNDAEVLAKTKPFKLIWTYGMNAKVGIINLTVKDRKEILFASGHSPILYNYCTKQMKSLEGHQYLVTCISADYSGRWLVTADNHQDGVLIIWDSTEYKPILTLFNIYPQSGVLLLRISETARYLITIGRNEKDDYTVDFWLWTLGGDEPSDTFVVDKSCGLPVAICFNPDIEEHIMIVFQDQVFLLVWNTKTNKYSNPTNPQITHKDKVGAFTGGTYVEWCHQCYASSSKGCLAIFANTLYSKPFGEGTLDNSKIFINAVRVSPTPIDCCTTTDGLLVTGDKRGYIFFFDKRVRILYWLKNFALGPISSISFSSVNKIKYQDPAVVYIPKPREDNVFECDYKDLTEEMEIIFRHDLPQDASLDRSPFLVNNFFVATTDCNIYAVDCVFDKCEPLFLIADACVSALETHEEFNYIVIGYENGRLMMVDYEKNEMVCSTTLSKTDNEKSSISCLKYSHDSLHLVCGRANGEVWMLEPILLTPKKEVPFKSTKNKVVKIRFSINSTQFAYYDSNRTVVYYLYHWESGEWQFGGKIRSHYDEVNDIIFMPFNETSVLHTIGKDKFIVEYNNNKKEDEDFCIVSRERIEQTAVPMNFIYWFQVIDNRSYGYFVVADDQHKIKFLYQASKIPKTTVLAPAFGCFKNQSLRKMKIMPQQDSRYMIFLTDKHIGLHMFPPDGNPYKYVGCLAHPVEVGDFVVSRDGKHVFTFGKSDHAVYKWEVMPRAVELMYILGGTELEPFYCLIEGGKNGWLFQEIKDLFYYMQILQQESLDMPRRVTDSIRLSELPDLVRTCGFYPTEFELENMMLDIKYRNFYETGKISEEINFIDFVKLFCNHKPAYGYSQDNLEKAFLTLVTTTNTSNKDAMKREDFVEILTTAGEAINLSTVHKYLKTLMRDTSPESSTEDFEFLPSEINYNTLFEVILGIDMTRSEIIEFEKEDECLSEIYDRTDVD